MLASLFRALLKGRAEDRDSAEGFAAWQRGDPEGAEIRFRRAIASGHDAADVLHGFGTVLVKLGKLDEGVQALRLAVEREPLNAGYQLALGTALASTESGSGRGHRPPARGHAARARGRRDRGLSLQPGDRALRLAGRRERSWRTRRARAERAAAALDAAGISVRHAVHAGRARAEARGAVSSRRASPPAVQATGLPRRGPRGERLRIGYVSADFRNHATTHLAAGLFERHDRERFEIIGYSFGATTAATIAGGWPAHSTGSSTCGTSRSPATARTHRAATASTFSST